MTYNSTFGFYFDKDVTSKVYYDLKLKFENLNLNDFCLSKIENAMAKHNLTLGIDVNKPWEEIIMEEYYQIEYLFVGEILNKTNPVIDDQIGINIFQESKFGAGEFGTNKVLNLTFIINKN